MLIADIEKPTERQRTVRIIPANVMTTKAVYEVIREAVYARVSTKKDEQTSSKELQKRYLTAQSMGKSNAVFVGLYEDEESGKSIAGRAGFQELLKDCYAGKIDRIVTKTVSRFARNMVECLQVARDLKNRGITIYFDSQGLDTKDESSFVILSILAALAEEEIRTMSNNIKWGIHNRWKEGKVHMSGRMLGYDIKDGNFTIVPEEVEAVQGIFTDYLKGSTIRQIKAKLERNGVLTASGNKEWSHTTIANILQNEKYTGNVILGKTFKVDVLSPRQVNNGQRDMTEILNHHQAIIDQEIFNAVQAEITKREYAKITLDKERNRYSSEYALSTKLECGECGTKFRRHAQTHGDKKVDIWVCIHHQHNRAECGMKPVKERDVQDAFLRAFNKLVLDRTHVIDKLETDIKHMVESTPIKDERQLQRQLDIVEQQIIALGGKARTADWQTQNKALIDQAKELRGEIKVAQRLKGTNDLMFQRLKEIKTLLKMRLETFNADIFRSLVERVIVHGKGKLHFIFKCGLETTDQTA